MPGPKEVGEWEVAVTIGRMRDTWDAAVLYLDHCGGSNRPAHGIKLHRTKEKHIEEYIKLEKSEQGQWIVSNSWL